MPDALVWRAVPHVEPGMYIRIPMNPNLSEMTVAKVEVVSNTQDMVTINKSDVQVCVFEVRRPGTKPTFSLIRFVWEWLEVVTEEQATASSGR